jgi:hypothetical protein
MWFKSLEQYMLAFSCNPTYYFLGHVVHGRSWVGRVGRGAPETGEKRSFLTLYLTVAALWWLIRIFSSLMAHPVITL